MSPPSYRLLATASLFSLCVTSALAEPTPRPLPLAGSIVAAKGSEELRLVREGTWRWVELQQDLIRGDTLRTNATGNLAILFADQTQIRVGRNSTLVVNEVASAASGATQLELQSGQVWARASRGGSSVDIRTPAATAAIRGTDWSLSVDSSGRTALVVLEGEVELKNPQGSVLVRQGEGAFVAIGQAPTKIVIVRPKEREQMLFHLSVRNGFTFLPASPLEGPQLRSERARLEAIAPEHRSAEDWLSLAEVALSLDGQKPATLALNEATARPLTPRQKARADLVAGLLAGAERRWSDAAGHLARAERRLDGRRRIVASYGHYFAASLADPKRVLPEPKIDLSDPVAAAAHAFAVGFMQGLEPAADLTRKAESSGRTNALLTTLSADLAVLLDRRDELRVIVARGLKIDPDDPGVLIASARLKGYIDSDIDGALKDLRHAATVAPGSVEVWNAMALFEQDRGALLEAEGAFKRAIEVDPYNAVPYANYALLLLDQDRVNEAGPLIDKALELDPGFYVGYTARGRYFLQKGDMPKAVENLLAGSAANPAYAQGLLALAFAYYMNGDVELADQALDNADRLDPNDPVTAEARTAVALDQYQADKAIESARELMRRRRQRGGYFATITANQRAGSYLGDAYRFLELDEWARFYGDRVFDPFTATSYFDQAANRRQSPVINRPPLDEAINNRSDAASLNSLYQGLFFDPLAVSSRIGRIDLLRRPFIDSEISTSLVLQHGKLSYDTGAQVQGFSNASVPTSFSISAGRGTVEGFRRPGEDDLTRGSFFVGVAPSAANRFLLFGAAQQTQPGLVALSTDTSGYDPRDVTKLRPDAATNIPGFRNTLAYDARDTTAYQIGGGWSHTFGYRNVLTAAVVASRSDNKRFRQRSGGVLEEFETDDFGTIGLYSFLDTIDRRRAQTEGVVATIGHAIGIGDFTFRYGTEMQAGHTKGFDVTEATAGFVITPPVAPSTVLPTETLTTPIDTKYMANRTYIDVLWRPSDQFEAEASVQRSFLDDKGSPSDLNFDGRFGIAISPLEGHWLRGAYIKDTELPLSFSLAPVATVGLIPDALPLAAAGQRETLAFRWDAEWTPRLFTAVEYQHQNIHSLVLPIDNTLESYVVTKGKVDRLTGTVNLWLGGGIGVFGTISTASSDDNSPETGGSPIPFVAERFARVGITFVHPSRIRFTLAQSFIGDRTGNLYGTALKDYSTTNAFLSWETPDRRLLASLAAINLLDREYELAPGLPGPRRTISATLKARF